MFDPARITRTPEANVPSAERDAVYFDVAGDYTRTMRCWAPAGQDPTPERVGEALDRLARPSRRTVESQMLALGGLELNLDTLAPR